MFCASVSSYRYKCSKFITTPMIHERGSDMIGGERAKEFCGYLMGRPYPRDTRKNDNLA